MVDPIGAAFAVRGAGQALDFQFHQSPGGEADHLAQQINIGALLQKRPKAHHLVGHRPVLGSVVRFGNQTLPRIYDDPALDKWPTAATLVTIAAAGPLTHSSYTITRGVTSALAVGVVREILRQQLASRSRKFPNDRCLWAHYILGMDTILPFLLGGAMLATLGVLFAGVIAFAFNTKTNAKYANKLMTARVVCQAVAVALFGAMVLLNVL